MDQARRLHVPIQPANDNDGDAEARQEPKQFALQMFLDHPNVFNAASDMLSYTTLSSFSEFAGDEEGVDAQIDDDTKAAFRRDAECLFQVELRGRYCRIGWYDDGDEVHVVVKHGAQLKTTEVIEGADDRVITIREKPSASCTPSPKTSWRLGASGLSPSDDDTTIRELHRRQSLNRSQALRTTDFPIHRAASALNASRVAFSAKSMSASVWAVDRNMLWRGCR